MLEEYYWQSTQCPTDLRAIDPSVEHEIYRIIGPLWGLIVAAGLFSSITMLFD